MFIYNIYNNIKLYITIYIYILKYECINFYFSIALNGPHNRLKRSLSERYFISYTLKTLPLNSAGAAI